MIKVKIEEAKANWLWHDFEAWANANGVSLEHPDDWEFSWHCFEAGAIAHAFLANREKIMKSIGG